jgi:hypothetical protein
VIPIDTSYDESMVLDTIDNIVAWEDMTQDVHRTIEEAPIETQVTEVKKEKITSYHNPHHIVRQWSFK